MLLGRLMDTYDIGVIGMGVAGAFACLKIAKEHKDIKLIGFDIGRPPQKRRSQMCGFFGCLPNSDGKLYLNDISSVSDITGNRKTKTAEKWFNEYASNVFDMKIIKDRSPNISLEKKIKKNGFDLKLNDYVQLYPKDIHALSKYMARPISESKNMIMSFDNEVLNVSKEKNSFIITSYDKKVECKRIIVCTGRSGWRWTKNLYDSFGIVENNDTAKFGIRVEATTSVMKDFNRSNCSITKNDLDIGPLTWHGTIIPEDHVDFAISTFRSNENRWKSDKVSFNLMANRNFENNGFEQTERIGQLTFVLANDRIMKEKISTLVSRKSKISIIPEYDWLPEALEDVEKFMPDVISRGYFHIPTILPLIPKIKIGSNLVTDVNGLYCAGEASGAVGILSAILTGLISADSACK